MRGLRVLLPAFVFAALLGMTTFSSAAPQLNAKVRAPVSVYKGQAWTASITVTRAGQRVGGLRVIVTTRRAGVTRSVRARPVRRGVYRARIVFSTTGTWAYSVRVGRRALARGSVIVRAPKPMPSPPALPVPDPRFREWSVAVSGQTVHPHDVWPVGDGTIWYTGQLNSTMGRLNPVTGAFTQIPLPAGARPHGVIADSEGDAWVTDQGLNAIVRVDSATHAVTTYEIPTPGTNPNTATFDLNGDLWFTGNSGYYGKLDRPSNTITVWPAPRGFGHYGIHTTPSGAVYYVSLRGADDYLGRIDVATGDVTVIDTPGSGARRVWSDSNGRLWVTEYNSGHIARYDPSTATWREWLLPSGSGSEPYAVTVDSQNIVWITSFGTNALVRFDPVTETFGSFRFPTASAAVRQIVGAGGVIWGAESGTEKIVSFTSG